MTDPGPMDAFELRFAARATAWTDPAAARRIDALKLARTAMTSRPSGAWSVGRWPGPRRRVVGAVIALAAVLIIAVVVRWLPSDALIGRPSALPEPTVAPSIPLTPIPAALQHPWQRPYAVTPGTDTWGSGFASFTSNDVAFGAEPGADPARSIVEASATDRILVTATEGTKGCAAGDLGLYRWAVTGSGTVLILTAIDPDACPTREPLLAGTWVRSDMTGPAGGGDTPLSAGTHAASSFDPFGLQKPGAVSFTVPEGWGVISDDRAALVLHHPSPDGQDSDTLIALFAAPRVVAALTESTCGTFPDAPHVDGSVDEIEAAITKRQGVVAGPTTRIKIGDRAARIVDLSLAPAWAGPCRPPDGQQGGMPLLHVGDSTGGAVFGIGPDQPGRLILVDLGNGRTMAIAIVAIGPSGSPPLEDVVAMAMPIVESINFHPPAP